MKPLFLKAICSLVFAFMVLQNVAANTAPSAFGDSLNTTKNTALTFKPSFGDADLIDDHIATAVTNPVNGAIAKVDDTTFLYTPNNNYVGLDTFTYSICDNGSPVLCSQGFVRIYVGCEELIVNGGKDSTVCGTASIVLGGNPTAAGGSAPYTYNWQSTIGISPVANPVINPSGSFHVFLYVMDANGCIGQDDFQVTTSAAGFFVVRDSVRNTTCAGNDGYIQISVTGTGAPFSYAWTMGATTEDITGLVAGAYTVTVTENSGLCKVTRSFTLTPLTIQTIAIRDTTCAATGSIDINVVGGGFGYSYLWSNATITQDINSLSAGTYSLTVTDADNCTATQSYTISNAVNSVLANAGKDTALCSGSSLILGGSATAIGGTGPYTYRWSGVNVTDTALANPVVAAVADKSYYLTVTDANGCTNLDTIVVNTSNQDINIVTDSVVSTCVTGVGGIYITASSGSTPLSYAWSNAATTDDIAGLAAGTYTITVTNAATCTKTQGFSIQNSILDVKIGMGNRDTSFCYLDTFRLQAVILMAGSAPYIYDWTSSNAGFSFNDTLLQRREKFNTTFYLKVTDSKGCFDVDTMLVRADTCVWPGDANYDGAVLMDDVLQLGVAFDSTGFGRQQASNTFISQVSENWNRQFAGGLNYEHADCDGNAVVNHDDTLAISLNYSRTHSRGGAWVNGNKLTDPMLFTKFNDDTIAASSKLTAAIQLGNIDIPATGMLGISFRMHFPVNKVDTFLGLDFSGNWFVAGNSNPIFFRKLNFTQGYIDVCAVRTNHSNNTGFGLVANADFVMKDDITGKDNIAVYSSFPITYTDVKMISATEDSLPVYAEENATVLVQLVDGIKDINEINATVYPNPVHQTMLLIADGVLKEILLMNSMGESIMAPMQINGNSANIDAADLAAGVYYLHLTTANGKAVKRIVKY